MEIEWVAIPLGPSYTELSDPAYLTGLLALDDDDFWAVIWDILENGV